MRCPSEPSGRTESSGERHSSTELRITWECFARGKLEAASGGDGGEVGASRGKTAAEEMEEKDKDE